MRIQNNIMAMNTHRMYTVNNNAVQKSAEKLSSGYRVNRAGDDAAGLAISEKMRAQIRGLNMASKNSQDAVSLVQTAEGALQEVHSMLQRMNELAVQSASGTNDSGVDRAALQQEFKNLQEEIDQIAETTTFNDMKIMDGSYSTGSTAAVGTASIDLGTQTVKTGDKIEFTMEIANADGTETVTANVTMTATVYPTVGGSETVWTVDAGEHFNGTFEDGTLTLEASAKGNVWGTSAEVSEAEYVTIDGSTGANVSALTTVDFSTVGTDGTGGGIVIQTGAEGGQTLAIHVEEMTTDGLGVTIKGKEVEGETTAVSIDTQANAAKAITATREAINKVSTQRAELGAMQNRLEHKISNLDNTAENLSAAESRIRDVDMAKEMTNFTKQNILSQAATAMLAQANAAPQGVLSLLQ